MHNVLNSVDCGWMDGWMENLYAFVLCTYLLEIL